MASGWERGVKNENGRKCKISITAPLPFLRVAHLNIPGLTAQRCIGSSQCTPLCLQELKAASLALSVAPQGVTSAMAADLLPQSGQQYSAQARE